MNIAHLQLFVRVAHANNISKAGRDLGLSSAVASAHLNKLEEQLGVRLIHRTTRKVSLTDEGQAFLPHAEEVLASIEVAKSSVGAGCHHPQGTLRVTAPASFGHMHLIPALNCFMDEYPDLTVELRLSDSIVDLVEGGFDIAIRNAKLKDSALIARKLTVDKRIICASPEYLEKHGIPRTPEDLKNHQCLNLIGNEVWSFQTARGSLNVKTSGKFRTDHGEAVRKACANGMGIAMTATWIASDDLRKGRLVQILDDYPLISDAAIWAVYPSSKLLAPKVRVFIDYFSAYYGNPPYWDKGL